MPLPEPFVTIIEVDRESERIAATLVADPSKPDGPPVEYWRAGKDAMRALRKRRHAAVREAMACIRPGKGRPA
jgi:hypothetical protein